MLMQYLSNNISSCTFRIGGTSSTTAFKIPTLSIFTARKTTPYVVNFTWKPTSRFLVCLLVCLFVFYLFAQAGFSGSYAADVGLPPADGFLEFYWVIIYRPTRGWTAELAVGLWCMVAWFVPATFYLRRFLALRLNHSAAEPLNRTNGNKTKQHHWKRTAYKSSSSRTATFQSFSNFVKWQSTSFKYFMANLLSWDNSHVSGILYFYKAINIFKTNSNHINSRFVKGWREHFPTKLNYQRLFNRILMNFFSRA